MTGHEARQEVAADAEAEQAAAAETIQATMTGHEARQEVAGDAEAEQAAAVATLQGIINGQVARSNMADEIKFQYDTSADAIKAVIIGHEGRQEADELLQEAEGAAQESAVIIQAVIIAHEARKEVTDILDLKSAEDSILCPPPDKEKVKQIIQSLDVDNDDEFSIQEVKVILSNLLQVPVDEIPDDHEEVVSFAGLSCDEMVERLCDSISKEEADEYWAELYPELAAQEAAALKAAAAIKVEQPHVKSPSIFKKEADRSKVEKIVNMIDVSNDTGVFQLEEVKILFSKLLRIPLDDIADDHREVVEFAGVTTEEAIDKLCTTFTRAQVNRYYMALFGPSALWIHAFMKGHLIRQQHKLELENDLITSIECIQGVMQGRLVREDVTREGAAKTLQAGIMGSAARNNVGLELEAERDQCGRVIQAGIRLYETKQVCKDLLAMEEVDDKTRVAQLNIELMSLQRQMLAKGTDKKTKMQLKYESDLMEEDIARLVANIKAEQIIDARSPAASLWEQNAPDKTKVNQIVESLKKDEAGDYSVSEVKSFLSKLLGVSVDDIQDDNHELTFFMSLSTDEMLEMLCPTDPSASNGIRISRTQTQEFWAELFPDKANAESDIGQLPSKKMSLFKRGPDKEKVKRIVKAVDVNEDGTASLSEVKEMFGKLLGIVGEDLPDDHEEVVEFAGMDTDAMVAKLCSTFSMSQVNKYYMVMCAPPASVLQGLVKGWKARLNIPVLFEVQKQEAAETIQSVMTGHEDRKEISDKTKAGSIISAAIIGHESRKEVKAVFQSSTDIIKGAELGHKDRLETKAKKSAGSILLGAVRACEIRKDTPDILETEKEESAQKIGAIITGHTERKDVRDAFAEERYDILSLVQKTVMKLVTKSESSLLLLKARPERHKVERIVYALDTNNDDTISVEEVKVLFSKVLQMDIRDIQDDHEEVVLFSGLSLNEKIDRLFVTVSKSRINQCYAIMFPSLLNPRPAFEKVKSLVPALMKNASDGASLSDVKILLEKLIGIPPEQLSDDSPDIMKFVGVMTEQLVDDLFLIVSKEKVDQLYDIVISNIKPEEQAVKVIQGAVRGWQARLAVSSSLYGESLTIDKYKVKNIVDMIDEEKTGQLTIAAVKKLFSNLLEIPIEEIPDDHDEVIRFTTMSTENVIDTISSPLCDIPKYNVDNYFVTLFPDNASTDEELRQEAADLAGVHVDMLPNARILRSSVQNLLKQLNDGVTPRYHSINLTAEKLASTCKLYDSRLSMEVIEDSIKAAGMKLTDTLTERALYHWIVLMFGDCFETEFIMGIQEFGAAAVADSSVGPLDIELREKAALAARVDIDTLPSAQILKGVSRWLFNLLADDASGSVPSTVLVETCKGYDPRASYDAIDNTIGAVDMKISDNFSEEKLYFWIVNMFGDCSEQEFLTGVEELGEAAYKMRRRANSKKVNMPGEWQIHNDIKRRSQLGLDLEPVTSDLDSEAQNGNAAAEPNILTTVDQINTDASVIDSTDSVKKEATLDQNRSMMAPEVHPIDEVLQQPPSRGDTEIESLAGGSPGTGWDNPLSPMSSWKMRKLDILNANPSHVMSHQEQEKKKKRDLIKMKKAEIRRTLMMARGPFTPPVVKFSP